MELKIEYVPLIELKTYANNAKIHTAEQIEQIKKSIQEFGMNDPIAVWKNNEIIEGHGRLIALEELGFDTAPVIRLDNLSDEQRRAYMLVHNKLTMNTDFDMFVLEDELANIEMDMSNFGFVLNEFDDEMNNESTEVPMRENQWEIVIECDSERMAQQVYDKVSNMGIECRISTL